MGAAGEGTTIRQGDARAIAWLALGAALTVLGCAAASGARRGEPAEPATVVEEGRASYYAAAFDGRRTASGERYDPGALTAAHPTLPFGTRLRVIRQDDPSASVEVRVNDRCGCRHGRIIDLSHEAARRLGMLAVGVVPVRLEVVPK